MTLEIQTIRSKRNELIHELATSMGRRERQRLREPQQRPTENISFAELKKARAAMKDDRADRMAEATKELADWYALLLSASNEAFIFEHVRRQQDS